MRSPRKRKNSEKQKKLLEKFSNEILQFLEETKKPLSYAKIVQALQVPHPLRPLFAATLDRLVEAGDLKKTKKGFSLVKKKDQHLTGIISIHPRGFGFVTVEGQSKDIFIGKNFIGSAVDGDRVEIELLPEKTTKGPEGKIISVLQRGRKTLGGVVRHAEDSHYLVYCPLLGPSKQAYLEKTSFPLHRGDRVVMKVVEWEKKILCELIEVIGNIQDPKVDVKAAVLEFGIQESFPKTALEQSKKCRITPKDFEGRRDLTKEETITIDPKTAKDFDDALSCSVDKEGNIQLKVHIADVSHFVTPFSPLDQEAYKRGNSVYFPGHCIPMLPPSLSNDLCSLKPNETRLTVTVEMDFSKEGELTNHSIYRSFIHSKKRFTYEEALQILEGKKKDPFLPLLRRLETLCHLLKEKRRERGSIDFALPETVLDIDENGNPTGVSLVEYDITHQLVEECMLKANEVVAKELSDRGLSLIFRVHEEPSEETLQDFFSFARLLGYYIPGTPTQEDIQTLFKKAKDSTHLHRLSVAYIRSMKLALYSAENLGHYGLALEYYSHFTSPIRRYTDLVIHRLLFEEEVEHKELCKIATHCSDQERIAMKAENSVIHIKKLRLLQEYQKKDPYREYIATVTKVRPFGIDFELDNLFLEGSFHISELGDDYFFYDEKKQSITGKWSKEIIECGTKMVVMIQDADLVMQEASFFLVQIHTSKKRKKKK